LTALLWDLVGQRTFETGVDHGILYLPDANGNYVTGIAWNGLVTLTESPSGAESNPQYADNIKYLNLVSAESFAGTIEAFTYPIEFSQCDGTAVVNGGISIGQQARKLFGMAYRTRIGNDLLNDAYGYKWHLVYGALVAPSERAYSTVNDSPEPITFSWEFSTTPVAVGTIAGTTYAPTATLTIDSTKVGAAGLAALENLLVGTSGTSPQLPQPADVIALFAGSIVDATVAVPTYNSTTKVITIPTSTGVKYQIDGVTKTGTVTITKNTIVQAVPLTGYKIPADTDTDWQYTF
jgi:hypothetical protein